MSRQQEKSICRSCKERDIIVEVQDGPMGAEGRIVGYKCTIGRQPHSCGEYEKGSTFNVWLYEGSLPAVCLWLLMIVSLYATGLGLVWLVLHFLFGV